MADIENNYDFRVRHWRIHKPGRRDFSRMPGADEILLTDEWSLGCPPDSPEVIFDALRDFQDYLLVSMNLSLRIVREICPKCFWLEAAPELDKGFIIHADGNGIRLQIAKGSAYRAVVHVEDCMNLERAPLLAAG
jgi:hypothetical protein